MRVDTAIVVPTRWGQSWQHFIQDALFRLAYAIDTSPESSHVILESGMSSSALAVTTALLGGNAQAAQVLTYWTPVA